MKKTLIIIAIVLVLLAVIGGIIYYNRQKKIKALFYENGKPRFDANGNPIDENGNPIIEEEEDLGSDIEGTPQPDLSTL